MELVQPGKPHTSKIEQSGHEALAEKSQKVSELFAALYLDFQRMGYNADDIHVLAAADVVNAVEKFRAAMQNKVNFEFEGTVSADFISKIYGGE